MDEKLNERGELAQKAITLRLDKAQEKHHGDVIAKSKEYQDAFETIYASYGERPPEELLQMLRKKEGDNFTVYQCKIELSKYSL